jgi:hypothetical protein
LAQAGDLFRHQSTLIARDGLLLPERCILCARAAHGSPVLLKFTWDPSFRVIDHSTLHLRQQGSIRARLCSAHLRRWRWGRLLGLSGVTLALAVVLGGMILGIISESSDVPRYTSAAIAMMIAGFAAFILSIFCFTLQSRTLTCFRIDGGYLYLEGAANAFLEPLPPLPTATP